MGYMHIENLYRDQRVMSFKQVFALEKLHGTSAHVNWTPETGIRFFSGGGDRREFTALFAADLGDRIAQRVGKPVTIYGEFYGGVDGKGQGMSATYGRASKFAVFDVKIGDVFLDVPKMDALATSLGLEVVHWRLVDATMEAVDAERDADSVQAVRNGMGPGKIREGVVLRPPFEVRTNNGARLIAKHKRAEFRERASEATMLDLAHVKAVEDAEAIADEWVVPMRLQHVTDKLGPITPRDTARVIAAMVEDIEREAAGEIVCTPEARTAIGRATAKLLWGR